MPSWLQILQVIVTAAFAAGGAWAAVRAELRALRADVTRHETELRDLRGLLLNAARRR